jgi:DNA-binding HxlR family transcriptional regulator
MQANIGGTAGPRADETGACPIGRASSLLGDRWILLIMREATLGVTRFDVFRQKLGIADNILSSRLRRLVDNGILAKVPYHDGRRQRHEYRLTEAGADLWLVLRALGDWGQRHTQPAETAEPMRVTHAGCGGQVGAGQTCAACGASVRRDEEAWIRPWRSPEAVPLARAL